MIPDTDGTGQETEKHDQQSGNLFGPGNAGIEAETEYNIHENGAQHDDDRNLGDRQDDLMAPMVYKNDVRLRRDLSFRIVRLVDDEFVLAQVVAPPAALVVF